MIFILHFGFGQRGAVMNAPVNRFEPLVDVAFVEEIHERARNNRLVGRRHRQIGIIPLPENAETDEVLFLKFDELCGVFTALRRICAAVICAFFDPSWLSTLISIGRPWQSQPGTYGESKPAMFFDLTMKSFTVF